MSEDRRTGQDLVEHRERAHEECTTAEQEAEAARDRLTRHSDFLPEFTNLAAPVLSLLPRMAYFRARICESLIINREAA